MARTTHLPPDRIRLAEFLEAIGLSSSTFYARFRWDPQFIREVDLRESRRARILHVDRGRGEAFARRLLAEDDLAFARSARARPLVGKDPAA